MSGAASLRIVPDRLQFFEYESVVFDCGGFDESTEWRVMRTIKGIKTICAAQLETSTEPCKIQHTLSTDSGEYWCEAKGETQQKSNSAHINVTGTVCEPYSIE